MYKNLREVVNQYAGHPWFMENYSNIIFELNHLELHFLDDYLFNLYMDEVSIDENPNNSNIAYLIGITSKEPTARIKTVGGGFPDVDCDFEQSRRDDVFTYLADKYGEGFAHIGTFGFAKAKNIFKVERALSRFKTHRLFDGTPGFGSHKNKIIKKRV